MAIPVTFEQVTHNSPDGAQMGATAADLIAFYGATPSVQPASSSQGAVTATLLTTVAATAVTTVAATATAALATTAATTSNANGYSTNTQADNIPLRINQLVVDANVFDTLLNKLIVDVGAYDGKINQAVVDIGALTVLVNQLRSELVTTGLIAGA